MVLVASDSSFFSSFNSTGNIKSNSSSVEELFHMPSGDELQLSLPASATTASCSQSAFTELGVDFASLRSPFADYAGAQQSSPTYSGQFLQQHSTDLLTRSSSNLYGSHQLFHPAVGERKLELCGENWIQQLASEELAFASSYTDPLTENYLYSMEYPPVYVSYLTDVNRNSSFLGWQPISDQTVKIAATNTVHSKRSSSCLTETQKQAKRVCIEKADKPARGSTSNSSSSGCTTTSTDNGNAGSKARPKQGTTEPQTLAARHRRERISKRLKILQNLVPNGSKVDLVTMLEKAINYVKFMQLQIQVLTADEYWPKKGAASEARRDERETTSEADVASTS